MFHLSGTCTYIIGNGSERILIDVGEGDVRYLDHLKNLATEKQFAIKYVLLTHSHIDHIGGLRGVLSTWPSAIAVI